MPLMGNSNLRAFQFLLGITISCADGHPGLSDFQAYSTSVCSTSMPACLKASTFSSFRCAFRAWRLTGFARIVLSCNARDYLEPLLPRRLSKQQMGNGLYKCQFPPLSVQPCVGPLPELSRAVGPPAQKGYTSELFPRQTER